MNGSADKHDSADLFVRWWSEGHCTEQPLARIGECLPQQQTVPLVSPSAIPGRSFPPNKIDQIDKWAVGWSAADTAPSPVGAKLEDRTLDGVIAAGRRSESLGNGPDRPGGPAPPALRPERR